MDQIRQAVLFGTDVDFEFIFVFEFADALLVVGFGPLDFGLEFVNFAGFSWVLSSILILLPHAFLFLPQGPNPPLKIFIPLLELALQLLYPKLQLLLSIC